MITPAMEELINRPVSFLSRGGDTEGVAISTRIRLARNLEQYPFPIAASAEDLAEICQHVTRAAKETKIFGQSDAMIFKMSQLSQLDREILQERRLVSKEFLKNPSNRELLVCPQEACSLMINEEDQLRLQSIRPGLQLQQVWKEVSSIDDQLGKHLNFAFDEQLGFLSCCPTNVGTGLRASVMLHLPALCLTGVMPQTIDGINKLRLTVRGVAGEGSKNSGDLFQISNQSTLGESESKIISYLDSVIRQLISHEKNARRQLLEKERYSLLDHVGRAYGLLRHSYSISSEETLQALSGLRLGADLGLFNNIDINKVNELFIATSPGHLQKHFGKELSQSERDVLRASLCRDVLRKTL